MNPSDTDIMPHTPEWFDAHKRLITASRIAAILGRSEYSTAYEVALELTGRKEPFAGNESTRKGNRYEPAILGDYSDEQGVELTYPMPLVTHPTIPYLAATPDAQWKPEDRRLVEAKYSMSPKRAAELGEEGTDYIPDDWLLQVQCQMGVCGAPRCDVAVFLYGKLRTYTVEFSPDLWAFIVAGAREFWERLQDDKLPEPNWEAANTPTLIRSLHKDVRMGETVILSAYTEILWRSYQQIGEDEAAIKKRRDSLKAQVLHAIGDAEIGLLPDGESQLVRKIVHKKSYVVKETSYPMLTERKVKE